MSYCGELSGVREGAPSAEKEVSESGWKLWKIIVYTVLLAAMKTTETETPPFSLPTPFYCLGQPPSPQKAPQNHDSAILIELLPKINLFTT